MWSLVEKEDETELESEPDQRLQIFPKFKCGARCASYWTRGIEKSIPGLLFHAPLKFTYVTCLSSVPSKTKNMLLPHILCPYLVLRYSCNWPLGMCVLENRITNSQSANTKNLYKLCKPKQGYSTEQKRRERLTWQKGIVRKNGRIYWAERPRRKEERK